jgi:septum formation protein
MRPTVSSDHQEQALFRTLQPLVLASASPRRQRLLRSLGLVFDVVVSGVEEANAHGCGAEAAVRHWADAKARAVAHSRPEHWVLAADTIVVLGDTIFGKPVDAGEAAGMLERLSGRAHDVITAVCLMHLGAKVRRLDSIATRVRFKSLSAAEIRAYVASGEPLDKAGAYGIQGLGAYLVRSIEGSYTNVVGLPLCETIELLIEQGVVESH